VNRSNTVNVVLSIFLILGALLIIGFTFHFARQGEVLVKGRSFKRATNPPAFWFFTTFYFAAGVFLLFGAMVVLFQRV
jgi:hypothetical protein